MTESKIVATERLRREGRWEEASRFKDSALRESKAKGLKRTEASEAAWNAMLEKYPPLPPVEQSSVGHADAPVPTTAETVTPTENTDSNLDALLERVGGKEPDLPGDVLWVYDNLEHRKIKPDQAPSLGAWSLLKWARDYRNRFFEQLLPKALAVKEGRAKEGEAQVVEDLSLEEVKRLLREVGGRPPADVPGAVRGLLSEWTRRFALPIADDALAALEADVCRLVLE